MFFQHDYLKNKIDVNELYKRYNIQDKIEQFDKQEDMLQYKIVDAQILKFYSEKWKAMTSIEDIKMKYQKQLVMQEQQFNNEKEKILEENKRLENEIKELKNSRFYKWTRFLRRKNNG